MLAELLPHESGDGHVAKYSPIDIDRFRVPPGRQLTLERHDPTDTYPFEAKDGTRRLLQKRARRLYELTELLYAQNRWSVLFIFQAMDGAGKDSAIKHVMRGLDPKSTQVYTFKSPSSEELKHDFMWRCMKSASRARTDRHLQPVVLRRSAHLAGPSGAD